MVLRSFQALSSMKVRKGVGRAERLQIMLTDDELVAIDDWRFGRRMPSRAAAIRELLKRGMSAEGFVLADKDVQSKDFGVVVTKQEGRFINDPKRRRRPRS
jgi:hypothetical protein